MRERVLGKRRHIKVARPAELAKSHVVVRCERSNQVGLRPSAHRRLAKLHVVVCAVVERRSRRVQAGGETVVQDREHTGRRRRQVVLHPRVHRVGKVGRREVIMVTHGGHCEELLLDHRFDRGGHRVGREGYTAQHVQCNPITAMQRQYTTPQRDMVKLTPQTTSRSGRLQTPDHFESSMDTFDQNSVSE